MFDDDLHDIEMDDTTGRYIVYEREKIGDFESLDAAKRFINHRRVALKFPTLPRDAMDDIGE
jgi:hypothetical protein